MSSSDAGGPVLFAYDGSDLAASAIAQAGRLLRAGQEALVVCVWKPFDIGFLLEAGVQVDASDADQIRKAAEQTAAAGARLARSAGFAARSEALEANPTWQGLLELADDCDAALIVLGSHGRRGVAGLLEGSVAGSVACHTRRPVLIAHGADVSER